MSLVSEMHEIIEQVVERYQVCWEVYPHEEMWNGTRIQTGFDVELYGTHCCNGQRPTPGCEHCLEVYDALQAIGLSICLRNVALQSTSSAHSINPSVTPTCAKIALTCCLRSQSLIATIQWSGSMNVRCVA
jgi:hypothetical protein